MKMRDYDDFNNRLRNFQVHSSQQIIEKEIQNGTYDKNGSSNG